MVRRDHVEAVSVFTYDKSEAQLCVATVGGRNPYDIWSQPHRRIALRMDSGHGTERDQGQGHYGEFV